LVATRKLSVQISDRKHLADVGLYEVVARVSFPDGRMVEDVGVVPIQGLRGDAACNAIMKAITKAKRRAILSACGLGMLDETETETIPGAQIVRPDVQHLEVSVLPAAPRAAAPAPAPAAPDAEQLATMRRIGQAWQDLGWKPEDAVIALKERTGHSRLRELSSADLEAYAAHLERSLESMRRTAEDWEADEADAEFEAF
jgi:hypothetical protein